MASGDVRPFSFNGTLLTTSATTLYTVPSGREMISLELNMCLITLSAAAVTARVHLVTSGETPANANRVVDMDTASQLSVGESRNYNFNPMLQPAGTIRALAHSANVVAVRGAGMLREI